MVVTDYNQTVQEWIRQVEEHRGKEAETTLNYAEKIKHFGEETKDETLLGFSYYYMAETYYMLNNVENFFGYIMQGLEYLQRSNQWELTAKACNLLGIASNNQGNAPFALDYYLSGVAVCEKNNLPLYKAIIEYNIGSIYAVYREHSRAIHYYESSLAGFANMAEGDTYFSYRGSVYISLASCYMESHKLERAEDYLSRIRNKGIDKLGDMEALYFLGVQARYYNEVGSSELRDKCILEIEKRLNPNVTVMEIFDDFYNYCEMLLEIDKYKELWNVLDILDGIIKTAKLVHLQKKLLTIKLEYYKKVSDNKGFLQAAGLYYELSQMKEKEEKYVTGAMLNVRFSLEEAKKKQRQVEEENQLLQHRSETDSLTGIANRMYLNEKTEEIFQRCVLEQRYFGVEILDVDFFKEYNDNYGHQQGDECLRLVAEELKAMMDHGNIFCGRYGGDEFCLIYENYTPKQVKRLAEEMKRKIGELAIEHKFSKALPIVTISQGICCDIPHKDDKVWDFLRSADVMLYRVKGQCRNGVSLGKCDRGKDHSEQSGQTQNKKRLL